MSGTAPVSVVVLTFNEERNLEACLASVASWARAVFVVDSGSTDRTTAIAQAAGAIVVKHSFETHARQWRWALSNLALETEWVLALDADQRVTTELAGAIVRFVGTDRDSAGGFVNRRQIFRGRWIRHGGYYPKYLLKLFRRSAVTIDDADLVDHHFEVSGPAVNLTGDLIEDNQNEAAIAAWTEKHNRYAVLQARQEYAAGAPARVAMAEALASPAGWTRFTKRWWARMPLYLRPCLYATYRYIVRLGFLDGREGFVFHVLQGFWYRLLVDINIDELRRQERHR